jgi:nucleoside 2-deoxyribosyltransferase
MRIFISFRFTGEDPKELAVTIQTVEAALRAAGHTTVCSFWEEETFREKNFTPRQILDWALHELDAADCIFSLVKTEDKSEGMLIESGYALAKGKRRILAIREGVRTTFMREIADTIIDYQTLDDLCAKSRTLK